MVLISLHSDLPKILNTDHFKNEHSKHSNYNLGQNILE